MSGSRCFSSEAMLLNCRCTAGSSSGSESCRRTEMNWRWYTWPLHLHLPRCGAGCGPIPSWEIHRATGFFEIRSAKLHIVSKPVVFTDHHSISPGLGRFRTGGSRSGSRWCRWWESSGRPRRAHSRSKRRHQRIDLGGWLQASAEENMENHDKGCCHEARVQDIRVADCLAGLKETARNMRTA